MNTTKPNQPSLDDLLSMYEDRIAISEQRLNTGHHDRHQYEDDLEETKEWFKAQLERLITEARIAELKEHGDQWRVWLDDTVDVKLKDVVAWYDLRIKELQATLTEPQRGEG